MRQRTRGDTRYKAKHQMVQSQRNFPIKTTSLHLQTSFNPIKQSMHRSKTSTKKVPVEMTAHPPVEIGTRGTMGSLPLQTYCWACSSNSEEEKERMQQHAPTKHMFYGENFREQASWDFRFQL
ncbi:hypothetical protein CRYUN_Cryun25bG0017500 [Craigia yunnanensis]